MGFYTVLSLNRIDVNVRDIFASGELPHLHFSLPLDDNNDDDNGNFIAIGQGKKHF